MNKNYLVLFLLFAGFFADAQKLKKADRELMSQLQQHVQYLSDDKLEGRRTGTIGEKLAAEYISNEFQKIGLIAKGSNNYLQQFEIDEGRQINSSTHFFINGSSLVLHKEYFPLNGSPDISLEALPSIALQEPGMPWFLDIKNLVENNSDNPHFDIHQELHKKVKEVHSKKATSVFVYNTSERKDGLKFSEKEKPEPFPIPVIYITKEAAEKYLSDQFATLDIKLKVDIGDKTRSGSNVIGYIDNGAPATVIIGAHYDHLGYGEDGNSRETADARIHNGADDNASGTSAMIELARLLKNSEATGNNYLFIAFSGEELGLYGSKFFTENPTIDLGMANYMINMDMVGRLNDSSHVLTVGGYGTSPAWGEFYSLKGRKRLHDDGLEFRFDSSGTGPSDHTSFYLKNIPVLFYFTGLHTDYHKPGDDHEKINYIGQLNIVKHILDLIETQSKEGNKLVFTKTREKQTTTSTRFSVTLGIMPDYTFNGGGLRVDGVSDNRPAQKAGIQAGDIIISLGENKISSMESYMQALGKFKKGDKTTVVYTRSGKTLSSPVEF